MRTVVAVFASLFLVVGCGSAGSGDSSVGVDTSAAPSSDTTSDAAVTGEVLANTFVDDHSPYEGRPSITEFCGDKPITIGVAAAIVNAWTTSVVAQIESEAAECDTVQSVKVMNADNDPAKFASIMSTFASEGTDVILSHNAFGDSQVSALSRAYQSGAVVVNFNGVLQAEPGVDFTDNINHNNDAAGALFADFLNDVLDGEGQVVMLGGPAGDPIAAAWLESYKEAAEAYPGLELVQDEPAVTNWQAADTQQAVAGLLTSYPNLKGILTDLTGVSRSIIEAYLQSGQTELPAIAGGAIHNDALCAYEEYAEDYPSLQLYSADGTTNLANIAVRKGVAAAQGIMNDEASFMDPAPYFDSRNPDMMPGCIADLPANADPSGDISLEDLLEAFG